MIIIGGIKFLHREVHIYLWNVLDGIFHEEVLNEVHKIIGIYNE